MAALRSLTDDDFDAGYDRAEARAHVDYDGTTDYVWDGLGLDAAETRIVSELRAEIAHMGALIESLAVEHPPRDGAARDERLPSTASATEREAA